MDKSTCEDFDIGFSPNANFGEEDSEGLVSTREGLQNDVKRHEDTGTTGGDESFDEGLVKYPRTVQLGDTLPGPVTVPVVSNKPSSRDSRRARAPKSKFKGTNKPLPEAVPFVKEHWRKGGSRPSCYAALPYCVEKRCDVCNKEGKTRCQRCKQKTYCSLECKNVSDEEHLMECPIESVLTLDSVYESESECEDHCEVHLLALTEKIEDQGPVNPYDLHKIEQLFLRVEAQEENRETVY